MASEQAKDRVGAAFNLLVMLAILTLLLLWHERSVPVHRDGALCWVVDFALPFEGQGRDVYACVAVDRLETWGGR